MSRSSLLRTLHDFMERSGLFWSDVHHVCEVDRDGRPMRSDDHEQIWFRHNSQKIDIVIHAPGVKLDGVDRPLGWMAARKDQEVVKGPIDQATWDRIETLIRGDHA